MNRIFVDLDGVVVDFDKYKTDRGMTGDEVKRAPGAYLDMEPIAGAIEAVQILISLGFEVWIATKPPTGVAFAYADKVAWVLEHLPYLKRRIILTHDKGLLGGFGDWLIDDRIHKANCREFQGDLIEFKAPRDWLRIVQRFKTIALLRKLPRKTHAIAEPPRLGD